MADRRLILVGAGGHAGAVVDVARAAGWEPQAAFDPDGDSECCAVPIVGDDGDIPAYLKRTLISSAVVAIGENSSRLRLANEIRAMGCATPAIVHPRAHMGTRARIAQGVVVMPGAVISANADIAADCIVNSGAIIEHDCVIERGVHIAPGSILGGNCHIGKSVLVGLGATVRPGISIGDNTIIGAGAVVVSDMPDRVLAVGVPAAVKAAQAATSQQTKPDQSGRPVAAAGAGKGG